MANSQTRNSSPDGLSALMDYVARLSSDDIDDILSKRGAGGVMSDEEMAFSLFAEDAQGILNIRRDRGGDKDDIADELYDMEEMARAPSFHSPHVMPMPLAIGAPESDDLFEDGMYDLMMRTSLSASGGSGNRGTQIAGDFILFDDDPEFDHDYNSSSGPLRTPSPGLSPGSDTSSEIILDFDWRPFIPDCGSSTRSPHGSAFAADTRRPALPRPECVICGDAISGPVISTPCGHSLDVPCLRTMFERATLDETLFPPKCCQTPLEVSAVQHHLPAPLRARYADKGREFTTADRVYCHIPTCGAFLGPRKAHDSAAVPVRLPVRAMPQSSTSKGKSRTLLQPSLINNYACTACGDHTCKSCKTAAHPGRACAEADLQRDVLALGRAEGWQRCPACGHLVELNEGCYHITCRCAKQFCYLCAATWKECGCPQFHDPGEGAVEAGPPVEAAAVPDDERVQVPRLQLPPHVLHEVAALPQPRVMRRGYRAL